MDALRLVHQLSDDYPYGHDESHDEHQQARIAEEMHGLLPESAQEGEGNQVQQPVHEAVHPELALAVFPFLVENRLLSDLAETANLYQKTGAVDILVLNASVQYKERWLDITDAHFEAQVNVNLRSTWKLMQLYYPAMEANGWGRIVTVGSVNQHRQHPELSMYAATKCAVMSLVKNIAKTAAPHGVTVNNISPGAIRTPRNEAVWNDPAKRAAVEAQIPAGRFGTAEEVANAVLFLCGEDAGYITGDDLTVDGGMRL